MGLVGTDTFKDELMKADGPPGTLSQRVKMAYALGRIGPGIRNNLHSVRTIRNSFAYRYRVESFNHQDIDVECKNFEIAVPDEFSRIESASGSRLPSDFTGLDGC
jgi:hypothetical protein